VTQSAGGNVISLDARARFSAKESADVLAGCRDLARDRMAHALSGMLDRLEDDLFDLAEKAPDRDAQNVYLDARTKARDKRRDIEAVFARHFVECFDRKARRGPPAAATQAAFSELALIAEEDLEEAIAVQEMSRKIEAACEGELGALSERMALLLENPALDDEANPLSPATVCAALKDACDEIQAGFKVRMTLLRQFEHYAGAELERVYHELNSHLVERRVLPEVRPGMPRASALRRCKTAQAARAARSAPSREAPQSAPVLAALARLLGVSLNGAEGGAPALLGPSDAAPAPQTFVAELTRMHREDDAAADVAALTNVIKRIKAAPQSASLGTVDAMTIDLVAMLFDHIFDDGNIPASIKALLGRLQIPVLKAALLDKNFFSTKGHPARRLLDALAQAAIGIDESAREGAVLAMIGGVVDRVLDDFETDVTLFESLAARVAEFIEEHDRAEARTVARSAELIEERELDETAREHAAEEIARHLEKHAWVPAPVREILGGAWVRALAKTARVDGVDSARWRALVTTMEELLWSVEPKAKVEERKRLVAMLPKMIGQLRDGMDAGELAWNERRGFLAALADCHAMAVKAGLRGIVAVPDPKPLAAPAQAPRIERARIATGGIQLQEIRLRGAVNVFTRTGIWTNLQRGTWVEFAAAGETAATRARLTWISPNKGVYLFTNPFAADAALTISPEALAEQLRAGAAKIIDDGSLVDRAVSSILSELRSA
jgi:hypothetical protein